MIIEEYEARRILDLLASANEQSHLIRRLIIETQPGFRENRLRRLLDSNRWPPACHRSQIAATSSHRRERTASILENLIKRMSGRFLNLCGDLDYVEEEAKNQGASLAKDISHINDVEPTDLYDQILIYDVLDHETVDPDYMLYRAVSSLAPEGKIYVRCHPWCSRTGAHAYHSVNKAFVHLFFDEIDLMDLGIKFKQTRKITHPMLAYQTWFHRAHLFIEDLSVTRIPVESLFQEEPILKEILRSLWSDSIEEDIASGERLPIFQMEQEFLDYTLVPDTRSAKKVHSERA